MNKPDFEVDNFGCAMIALVVIVYIICTSVVEIARIL